MYFFSSSFSCSGNCSFVKDFFCLVFLSIFWIQTLPGCCVWIHHTKRVLFAGTVSKVSDWCKQFSGTFTQTEGLGTDNVFFFFFQPLSLLVFSQRHSSDFIENTLPFELEGKQLSVALALLLWDLFLLSPLCADTVQTHVCVFSNICWMKGSH